MASVTGLVNEFIERDPVVQRDLSRGLINTAALAKHMIKEGRIKASPDAVVTAIRRNVEDNDYSKRFKQTKRMFNDSRVSSKNRLAFVVLRNGESTISLIPALFDKINIHEGDTIRIVKSSESVEILLDEKNVDKVKIVFGEERIRQITNNVGAVTVNLSKDDFLKLDQTPGVFAAILNELAMNNINVYETLSCLFEIIIFVDEKDLLKSYEVLMGLCGE